MACSGGGRVAVERRMRAVLVVEVLELREFPTQVHGAPERRVIEVFAP